MVDRTSLEILGLILGGVTAVVIVIAVIVVRSHVHATATAAAVEQASPNVTANAPPVVPVALSPQR
jgi:hypothetical protein